MKLPHLQLPPGPSFILQQLFSLKVVGYGAFVWRIHVGGEMLGIGLPLWATFSSSAVALLAIIYVKSEFQYWKEKKKAQSLGARLAPAIPYKWPGGTDLIAVMTNVFNS